MDLHEHRHAAPDPAGQAIADRFGIDAEGELEIRESLPKPEQLLGRVQSLLCLHNIEGRTGQVRACREIARVLKPGGVALIADYVPTGRYASAFAEAGLHVVSSRPYFATALSLMWVVRAEKPDRPPGP